MEAVEAFIEKQGGPDVIQWRSVTLGAPGPGEVLVRQTAVGLNYIDTYHRDGTYPVDLPGGRIKVRVPAGAQSGGVLRVRGKGLPGNVAGNPPGDLILTLQVVLPPADTPQARELYATMARDMAFDPRHSTRS